MSRISTVPGLETLIEKEHETLRDRNPCFDNPRKGICSENQLTINFFRNTLVILREFYRKLSARVPFSQLLFTNAVL